MRNIIFILLLFHIILNGTGQTSDQTIDFSEITPPSNPALSLMGFEPKEINRPKSFKQLETTLINSFIEDKQFTIPKNFGIEFMPFWLRSQPEKEFVPDKLKKNECAPFENLGVSIGSVNENSGDTLFNTKLGLGFRTLIFSGKMDTVQINKIEEYKKKYLIKSLPTTVLFTVLEKVSNKNYTTYKEYYDDVIIEIKKADNNNDLVTYWDTLFNKFVTKEDLNNKVSENKTIKSLSIEIQKIIDKKVNDAEFIKLAKEFEDLQVRKYGFMWEVAASSFLSFPKGDIGYSEIPKFGLWTTATYRTKNQMFNFIAMLRYIRDYNIEEGTNNIDFGGSIDYNIDKISFSGELLQRKQSSIIERTLLEDGYEMRKIRIRYDYRATINISYRFSESIVLNYTFGKSFQFTDNKSNNLINMLSINVGLGNVPINIIK